MSPVSVQNLIQNQALHKLLNQYRVRSAAGRLRAVSALRRVRTSGSRARQVPQLRGSESPRSYLPESLRILRTRGLDLQAESPEVKGLKPQSESRFQFQCKVSER
ncbi:Hypothetical predicted protein [Xyrichtys novacula]|uniref:Uncharacterized protein n=1 Tax=Xyrichtys novacula TaxID=13765 RepID=A0AAV1HM41_XYRNO|nr:Hypothetical predicted protein [Xyrichtys novacula]